MKKYKPTEPQFLIDYRNVIAAGPPRCCHTCEMYNANGMCDKFDETPPEGFASTVNACDSWEVACPF